MTTPTDGVAEVQQDRRRLAVPRRSTAAEVELHGVRGSRRGHRDGAGEPAADRAVQVAARAPAPPGGARRSPPPTRPPSAASRAIVSMWAMPVANGGWWTATTVGWSGALPSVRSSHSSCSGSREPPGLRVAGAVEGDDPQRTLDHTVGAPDVAVDVIGERVAEHRGEVVVAGHEVERCPQPRRAALAGARTPRAGPRSRGPR